MDSLLSAGLFYSCPNHNKTTTISHYTTPMNQLTNITNLLHLPRLLPTMKAIILSPKQFFTHYNDLVLSRQPDLFDINYEKDGDKYLGPVKFSALVIGINNLLLPLFLQLGVLAGAVSPDFYRFAQWAKKEGYLDTTITGIYLIDSTLLDILGLASMYALGVLIWMFSKEKISIRFSTGYFFYINAWSLLGTIVTMGFILIGLIIPVYATGLPQLIGFVIQGATLFMFLLFPILFWTEILKVQRNTIIFSLGIALICWLILLSVLASIFIKIPQIGPA